MNSRRSTASDSRASHRKDSTPRHGRPLHPSTCAERDDRDHAAAIEFTRRPDAEIAAEGRIQQNSLLISMIAGNLVAETGSQLTASSASQSGLHELTY